MYDTEQLAHANLLVLEIGNSHVGVATLIDREVRTNIRFEPAQAAEIVACAHQSWDALPEDLQGLLLGREAIHVGKPYGAKWAPSLEERAGASMTMARGDPSADEERRHPAVLENPVTGRRMLFLNPTYVARLDGLSEEESRPILQAVQDHATRPDFCCRFRWSAGTLVVWDNLATQHYAVNDYQGQRRLMYRTTFLGPKPKDLAAAPEAPLAAAN